MTDCNKIQANNLACNKISLTEQLYAGTLPTGHYYFNNGVETYIVLYKNINTKDRKTQEPSGLTVISEVPSYEQWQASEKYNKHLEEVIKIYEQTEKQHTDDAIAYNELKAENDKLKSILEECSEALLSYGNFNGDYELYDKITGEIK